MEFQRERLEVVVNALASGKGVWTAQNSDLASYATDDDVVIAIDAPRSLSRRLDSLDFEYMQRYSVLPSRRHPRWLLPTADLRTMLSGFNIYKPFGFAARMLKSLIVTGIACGWRGTGRPRVVIACRRPLALHTLVRQVTGVTQPVFSISIGNRQRFRALVLQAMRGDGEVLGYLKLPLTEAATARVRHEANVLEWLWAHSPALRPHIPQVLYSGDCGTGFVLFQSPVRGRRGPQRFGTLHTDLLRKLWRVAPMQKPGAAVVEQVGAEWRRVQSLVSVEWHHLGQAALSEAHRELVGVTVPCGISHGDFAPWNTRQRDRQLMVFDWESASREAPQLFDVFHFDEQSKILLRQRALQYGTWGLRSASNRGVFLLYSLWAACEAVQEGGPMLAMKLDRHKRVMLRHLRSADHPEMIEKIRPVASGY